jgi:GNAT superfamily N-acetyltransferase
MITFTPIPDLAPIQRLKQAYLQTLTAPLDGYWKEAIIDPAPHWQMHIDGQLAGYFALDAIKKLNELVGNDFNSLRANRLLQFYVAPRFAHRAADLFAAMVTEHTVKTAVIFTSDPVGLVLGMDWQTAVSINSYLFEDHRPIAPALPAYPHVTFRQSTIADLEPLLTFYARNDEESDSAAIDANFGTMQKYVEAIIMEGQSFALRDGDSIIGIGEWRVSQAQPPYVDLGMVTDREHRRRGVGTYILTQFKQLCTERGLRPICSCDAGNIGSRKTIEKAGFISSHRIVEMELRK